MSDQAYILGVDDEPLNRVILEELLDGHFDYQLASSGQECLDAVAKRHPDLILLDVNMPQMTGLEVCRQLRGNSEYSNIPIIFVSALTTTEERLAGYEAGGDDYVTKPFSRDELFSKIKLALKNRQAIEQLSQSAEYATSAAMTAMASAGEMGVLLQFLRDSFSCEDFPSLATCMLESVTAYGLSGSLLIKEASNTIRFYSGDGITRPLEEKVMSHLYQTGKRIVEFGARNIYNAPSVSLLIRTMPVDDMDKYGRLKDHLAIFIEGADARVNSLMTHQALEKRQQALSDFIRLTRETLLEIDEQHRVQRKQNVEVLSELVRAVESSFLQLGLTDVQEEQLLALVTGAEARTDALYEKGFETEDKFEQLTDYMKKTLD